VSVHTLKHLIKPSVDAKYSFDNVQDFIKISNSFLAIPQYQSSIETLH